MPLLSFERANQWVPLDFMLKTDKMKLPLHEFSFVKATAPDINTFPKLAEVFGISVDELMQVKAESQNKKNKNFMPMIHMIMKAVALAMGVAVLVLSILKELDIDAGMAMLGIGLACLAIVSLAKKDES